MDEGGEQALHGMNTNLDIAIDEKLGEVNHIGKPYNFCWVM